MKWAVYADKQWLDADVWAMGILGPTAERTVFTSLKIARAWATIVGGKVIRIKPRRTAAEEVARIAEHLRTFRPDTTCVMTALHEAAISIEYGRQWE